MKLFLSSESKASIPDILNFCGGYLSTKTITYIPTAANGHYYGAWKKSATLHEVQGLHAKRLNIIQLEDSYYTNILEPISKSDILWFAGGMPGYLLYWLRRCELDKALPEILNKGTIYIGSSASSMVCSKTQYLSDLYIGESEPGASLLPGLGFIDFEIYPHYEDSLLPQIQKIWNKPVDLHLLKNGEAIILDNNHIHTVGESRVIPKSI